MSRAKPATSDARERVQTHVRASLETRIRFRVLCNSVGMSLESALGNYMERCVKTGRVESR
ncbi:MAG: hypothetical protein ACREB9_00200 [Thermoplasmata archaeon]